MGQNSIGGHCGWLCAMGWEQELIKPPWFWVKGRSDPVLLCTAAVWMGLGAVWLVGRLARMGLWDGHSFSWSFADILCPSPSLRCPQTLTATPSSTAAHVSP